jgi:holo-[acyl-carrier protein] synthase
VIVGVGVDLVSLVRFRAILARPSAERFIQRVFSESEIAYCRKYFEPAQAFAARFAAKEATAKAFGTGFSAGLSPLSAVVRHGPTGRPQIELHGAARRLAEAGHISHIHLSLSHTWDSACAFVVLEADDRTFPLVQYGVVPPSCG